MCRHVDKSWKLFTVKVAHEKSYSDLHVKKQAYLSDLSKRGARKVILGGLTKLQQWAECSKPAACSRGSSFTSANLRSSNSPVSPVLKVMFCPVASILWWVQVKSLIFGLCRILFYFAMRAGKTVSKLSTYHSRNLSLPFWETRVFNFRTVYHTTW